ncbi:MAG: hypothetical protein D3X82_02010 [Candidatus Leucobacter sulfamidivorax]|nr:hypothetical protein [Candidatus Leucobacter sulfamidivorax]
MTTQAGRLYDPYLGPAVDPAKWFHLEFPLPDGGSYVAEEPTATIVAHDGELRVAVAEFTKSHAVQPMDNCKFLLLSTEDFQIPAAGTVGFSATITADPIGATPYDVRDGFAAFVVGDMVSGAIFDVCTTGDVAFAIHEQLPYPGVERPYTRVVQDPLYVPSAERGASVRCSVEFDADARKVIWSVNGAVVHEAEGVTMPPSVKVGTGIFTVRPVEDGESRSSHGQGMSASWRDIRVPE